jgi:hypothetical protein
MNAFIDHLSVTAPSLERGATFVSDVLGVALQAGGEHPRMGTHNRLLRLGDDTYLEVIAINRPRRRPAGRAGSASMRKRPQTAPRLATWVARVDDIASATERLAPLTGSAEAMTRGAVALANQRAPGRHVGGRWQRACVDRMAR